MQNLIDAYTTFATAQRQYEANFDLANIFEQSAPVQSPSARAGELIVTRGGVSGAMRAMLQMAAERELSDLEREVAALLADVSIEV